MKYYFFVTSVLCLSASSLFSQERSKTFDYSQNLGIYYNQCYTTSNSKLKKGDKITVTSIDESEKKDCVELFEVEIVEKSKCGENKVHLDEDSKQFSYKTSLNPNYQIAIGTAFLRNVYKKQSKTCDGVDINGDGEIEIMRDCASSEGMHFFVWKDRQKNKRLWHAYYYVSYETESDCEDSDFKGLK